MATETDDLLDHLGVEAGDNLRSVAMYGPESYRLLFIREDVQQQYLETEIDRIHEEMILEGIGTDYLENLFKAGDLTCSTHVFENGVMMHLVGEDHHGLFISFDSDPDVSILDVANRCKEWLRQADVEPLLD